MDCEWGDWVYNDCSKTCGLGSKTAKRSKKVQERNGGKCDGSDKEVEVCEKSACPPGNKESCNLTLVAYISG